MNLPTKAVTQTVTQQSLNHEQSQLPTKAVTQPFTQSIPQSRTKTTCLHLVAQTQSQTTKNYSEKKIACCTNSYARSHQT